MGAAETPRGGRPTKLTPELRDQLLAQLTVGAGLAEAAAASGISARTLRSWRQRAWSARPEDRPYVELERALRDARAAAPRDPAAWRSTAQLLDDNDRPGASSSRAVSTLTLRRVAQTDRTENPVCYW